MFILYCVVFYSIPLYCIALHCIALHYIKLHYITLEKGSSSWLNLFYCTLHHRGCVHSWSCLGPQGFELHDKPEKKSESNITLRCVIILEYVTPFYSSKCLLYSLSYVILHLYSTTFHIYLSIILFPYELPSFARTSTSSSFYFQYCSLIRLPPVSFSDFIFTHPALLFTIPTLLSSLTPDPPSTLPSLPPSLSPYPLPFSSF